MRITWISLLLLLTFCMVQEAHAQHAVRGQVIDSADNAGLQGALVRVLAGTRDSLIRQVPSDERGHFTLPPLASGNYRLEVNYLGYHTTRVALSLAGEKKEMDVVIKLLPAYLALDEVTIRPVQAVTLKGDTTEFDAAAFSTEKYADADALVTQIPGVEIDEDGQVKAQGETVQRIIVDGQEFFSSDPRVALKSLPADVISKIQIIDEKSEQAKFSGFDDGQRSKVINIVTRPDRRQGYSARVGAGYGADSRYNSGGHLNYFNEKERLTLSALSNNINQQDFSMSGIAGVEESEGRNRRGGPGGGGPGGGRGISTSHRISSNYSNKWLDDRLEFSGNYGYNTTGSDVVRLVNREYLIGANENQFNVQRQTTGAEFGRHQAGFRVQFDIDSFQRLNFSPNFSFQQSVSNSFSNNRTELANSNPVNASERNNDNRNRNFNIGGSLDYRIRLSRTGRTLSLNVNGSVNSNKGLAHTFSLNDFYSAAQDIRSDTVSNQNQTAGYGNGISGRLAYSEPITRISRVQASYNIRNNANYSNRETFEFLAETGQLGELNTLLSNEFRNDYTYHSGGISYQVSKRDTFNVDIGVDFQDARAKNHRYFPERRNLSSHFTSFLPRAHFMYRFSEEKNINFNYNTATNAPSINQLQDVVDNQNPLYIRTGNPNLEQEYRHSFSLRYNQVDRERGGNFAASVNAEFSNDRVVNSSYIATADTLILPGILLGNGGQFSRPENVDGYYHLRANSSFGIPIEALKINLNLNTGLHHTHDIGLLNGATSFSNSYGVNQRVGVNSKFGPHLVVGLSYMGNYSVVKSNMNAERNYNSYNQIFRNDITYTFWKGIRVASSIYYNHNTGLSAGYDQSFILWNASIGKKLLKREEAEISLSAYDLLNRNTNINRNISERFIEDSQTNALQRYFLLNFTYNLRKFGMGGEGGGGRGRY